MKISINKGGFKLYLWIGSAYFLIWVLNSFANYPEQFFPRVLNEAWRALYLIFLNYLFFEYTLANLSWKSMFKSLIILAFQIFLMSYGLYVWRSLGILLNIYTEFATYSKVSRAVSAQMEGSVASFVFYGIIRHIYDHVKLKQAAQQLRIEKQEAELNYLKSQTNPHFLFNTLNNIYSLARDKSDLAPESILRLSKILRFMLYEAGGSYISIEQELKIICDYIALEKLRYDESLHINLNHDIEDMKQSLPPLLLIPLVENAFKHGVSETRDQPFIDIQLSIKKRILTFLVRNSTETFSQKPSISAGKEDVKGNIGLSNLRRQLELLYTDFNLITEQGESVFTTTLKINLGSHV